VKSTRNEPTRSSSTTVRDGGRLERRPTAAHLGLGLVGIEPPLLFDEPELARPQDHLGVGQLGVQGVERADVVAVGVGQRDAHDRQPGRARGLDDRPRVAAQRGVHEREPIVLAHQERVHDAEPIELDEVVADGGRLHGPPE
jgi:hypothetical protein